jgi:hypothetical protein
VLHYASEVGLFNTSKKLVNTRPEWRWLSVWYENGDLAELNTPRLVSRNIKWIALDALLLAAGFFSFPPSPSIIGSIWWWAAKLIGCYNLPTGTTPRPAWWSSRWITSTPVINLGAKFDRISLSRPQPTRPNEIDWLIATYPTTVGCLVQRDWLRLLLFKLN